MIYYLISFLAVSVALNAALILRSLSRWGEWQYRMATGELFEESGLNWRLIRDRYLKIDAQQMLDDSEDKN